MPAAYHERVNAWGAAAPIFRVADLAASVDYYVNVLGFTVDWNDPGTIASVSRDRCGIFLAEGDQGHAGGWAWVGVADVDVLYRELVARGARVRHPPQNYPWACEMQIADLDGNVLRLGSDAKPDQPVGTWRDMQGQIWARQQDGRWTREGTG
jgi:catechol 2,3-dioxygenase-like lactoylglutathione lyase family enzyme